MIEKLDNGLLIVRNHLKKKSVLVKANVGIVSATGDLAVLHIPATVTGTANITLEELTGRATGVVQTINPGGTPSGAGSGNSVVFLSARDSGTSYDRASLSVVTDIGISVDVIRVIKQGYPHFLWWTTREKSVAHYLSWFGLEPEIVFANLRFQYPNNVDDSLERLESFCRWVITHPEKATLYQTLFAPIITLGDIELLPEVGSAELSDYQNKHEDLNPREDEIHKLLTGVPDDFITYTQSFMTEATKSYSYFIAHSSKDKEFAERLYADLQSKEVRCWYAPENLKIGEPFVLGIEQGIRLHDKLLLILSESSVNSGWVQHEVLSALAKEKGKAPWVLLPVRLDDAVMDTNVTWANMIRESRHIGDFTNWKNNDSYRKVFDRLLRDLKWKQ